MPAEPGAIAQLAERLDRTQEVGGSNPPSSIEGSPCMSAARLFAELSIASEIRSYLRHLCLKSRDAKD
jgi:hypothetical protein